MAIKTESSGNVVPPLKWAGGKRWFAANHQEFFPKEFNRYVEPFFGSGAVFFSMRPNDAIISDINSELINLYEVLRDSHEELRRRILVHHRSHDEEYFYKIRSIKPRSKITAAARTLYLNRTCWNGLYRVNLNGEFNVPKGTKNSVVLASDDFSAISLLLKKAEIKCQDFQISIDQAEKGDFLFVDPPYTVAHNNNGFIKYNQKLFCWDDQLRLCDSIKNASNRGVTILMTNAAHKSVIDLYSDFNKQVVDRKGIIAGSAMSRGCYQELVVKNY